MENKKMMRVLLGTAWVLPLFLVEPVRAAVGDGGLVVANYVVQEKEPPHGRRTFGEWWQDVFSKKRDSTQREPKAGKQREHKRNASKGAAMPSDPIGTVTLSLAQYEALKKEGERGALKEDSLGHVRMRDSLSRKALKIDSLEKELDVAKKRLSWQEGKFADSLNLLHRHLMFADSCIGTYCNGRLYQRYDSIKVEQAIRYFDRILSPDVKKYFGSVRDYLNVYKKAYYEFLEILEYAQEHKDDLDVVKYVQDCKKQVSGMAYVKNKKYKETSPRWLDRQISWFLERLDTYERDRESIDFSDLIRYYKTE